MNIDNYHIFILSILFLFLSQEVRSQNMVNYDKKLPSELKIIIQSINILDKNQEYSYNETLEFNKKIEILNKLFNQISYRNILYFSKIIFNQIILFFTEPYSQRSKSITIESLCNTHREILKEECLLNPDRRSKILKIFIKVLKSYKFKLPLKQYLTIKLIKDFNILTAIHKKDLNSDYFNNRLFFKKRLKYLSNIYFFLNDNINDSRNLTSDFSLKFFDFLIFKIKLFKTMKNNFKTQDSFQNKNLKRIAYLKINKNILLKKEENSKKISNIKNTPLLLSSQKKDKQFLNDIKILPQATNDWKNTKEQKRTRNFSNIITTKDSKYVPIKDLPIPVNDWGQEKK